jgi:hypothetical protein
MSKINDAKAVTNRPYGGYSLSSVKRAGGDETARFEAVLLHDGRPIAHVSNGGDGGSHRYQPVDAGGWAEIEAFGLYAAGWNASSDLAGIEDADQLVSRLLMVDTLNRARATPFLLDGEDYWASGEHAAFRGATPVQVLEALRSAEYAHRRPRVWSRTVGDFVTLD